jgi:predicted nucleic acid-binding protein
MTNLYFINRLYLVKNVPSACPLPLINIEWINAETHKTGVSALLAASRRKLSLVDCASFEIMRTLGIKTVFAFDPHFAEQGFKCIP